MNFNILPADIAANCNTKIVTDLSCRNLHAVTVRTVDDRDYYAQRSGAMAAVLDSGRIYITLPTIGNVTGSIRQYTYVICFEIFWESAVGGRSVVVVKNVGGDQADPTFLNVFEIFKDMLQTRLVEDFVDLTV